MRINGKMGEKMMEGLQICVRMTDGISFSLSSTATVTKGLLKKTPGQSE